MTRFRVMVVLLGIGIVLIALGPGIATCIHTEKCLADSPFWKSIYCASSVLSPNVQAAFLTIGLGGLIAWAYQRANKIMEFRFETFKDMAANMVDCCLQATLVRAPSKYIEDMASTGGGRAMADPSVVKQATMLEVERARLTAMANAGFAIWHRLHEPIFGEAVSDPWFKMNTFFRRYAEDPIVPKDFNAQYEQAMADGSAALEAARNELGMPYRATKLMREIELKHATTKDKEA